MKLKRKTLLAMIIIVIISGGVFFFKKVTILQFENMDHLRTIRIRISPSEQFCMSYTHSIYRKPVIEEFQVEDNMIFVKGVRSGSPAVMEYYGFQDMKEFHLLNKRLTEIYLQRSIGEGQRFTFTDKEIHLSEMGEKGDRIRLSIVSVPLGNYLFSKIFE